MLHAQRRGRLGWGILAGAALGLLALSYPPAMLCLPLLALWWWWNHGRNWRGVARAAACVAGGAAVIAPATIHNYRTSGEFFAIQSVVGINFRQGNGPGANGTITMIAGTSIDREKPVSHGAGGVSPRNGARRFVEGSRSLLPRPGARLLARRPAPRDRPVHQKGLLVSDRAQLRRHLRAHARDGRGADVTLLAYADTHGVADTGGAAGAGHLAAPLGSLCAGADALRRAAAGGCRVLVFAALSVAGDSGDCDGVFVGPVAGLA